MTAETRGLAVVQPQGLTVPQYSPAPLIDWEQIEHLVTTVYLRTASPEQRLVLMTWCKRFQLDPLAQDVVLLAGRPFVTLAGLIRVADRSGHYDGCTVASELIEAGPRAGKYIATGTVWRNDRGHPTVMPARQWEHERLKQPGKQDGPWEKSPAAMTEKCALSRALRLSFSLVGLTAAEEVGYDEESRESNAGTVVVIEPDQGRPGRALARLPAPGPAARVAQAGEPAAQPAAAGPEKTLDELAEAMLDWLAKSARNPKQLRYGVERLLGLTEDLALHEAWLATVLGLYEDQESRDLIRRVATPLVHQDALDAAWYAVIPPEVEAQEPDGGALQGDVPGDEHPDDVPL